MRELIQKLCLFLFLAALFSGRTAELGTLMGALTGTVLLWPFYRRHVPPAPKRRRIVVEESLSEQQEGPS
jgi:hypothetical protein